jgi:excisionase family DNA binding protein
MQPEKLTQVFGITPTELKQDIINDVRAELKQLAQNFQPAQPPEYLTRHEVAEILKVSLVTLSDWNKKGILNPYRLGNLIRYRRDEIEKALIQINKPKK